MRPSVGLLADSAFELAERAFLRTTDNGAGRQSAEDERTNEHLFTLTLDALVELLRRDEGEAVANVLVDLPENARALLLTHALQQLATSDWRVEIA